MTQRDMWEELREGATDGAVKKLHPDRGNVTDDVTDESRSLLQNAVNAYDRSVGGEVAHRRYTAGVVRGS